MSTRSLGGESNLCMIEGMVVGANFKFSMSDNTRISCIRKKIMLDKGFNFIKLNLETVAVQVSCKALRGKETKSSHFLFLHLALASPVASHSSVTSPDIPLGKNWSQAVTVFIVVRDSCIVLLMAQ